MEREDERVTGGLGHRNCDAAFISAFVRKQVVANEKYTLKMVQTKILRQHGVKISYWKAYRARERILQEVCGDFEGSFVALSLYMRELRSGDAEACLQLLYQDEGRFHRFFWAFGALIRAFRKHCRPLIGMDGTFLHYYATGALLIVSCIDGNNCILLLAWAVVEGENHYSWHWFLDQLRDGVVGDRDVSRANSVLAIIFDRQKGLIEAVSDVFPDEAHSYCMYHLSTNLPHAPKNTPAWRRFWAAARAYTVAEFNEHMEKMKELNPEQYKYVVKLPRHRWATHCFLRRRYLMLTSNYAETINSTIRHLKGLPITNLVEKTQKILESFREASRFYTLNPSTDVLFQVIAPDSTEVVDLSKMTCSCKRWDIDGIPCNHAMRAISFRLWDPYDFVEDWFRTSTYRATYNDYVPPTRGKEQ
ncbi:hypothetical protein ACMD2_24061 [Ananas comosus]|uniref:SWIM-type domain-containing protein n=1 Tax=Ananas comosus TaxID=4615 RepID=A0A199UEE1_ANACO|nr:hypothetical protein ACMD2_24061 [Ananas comosus]